ncbi:hypothetical protein HG530_002642 [Fusarium avenaceum]|nr:hypothetical protein HG530_002642 [Fusarium avenaceum]
MNNRLLYQLTENGEQIEDSKHLVLETLNTVGGVEENETDEESDKRAKSSLGVNVHRHAPVLLEHTVEDFLELDRHGGGKFTVATIIDTSVFNTLLLLLDSFEFGQDSVVFGALAPALEPVEVANHGLGVLADITEVDSLATLGQEKKAIKALEQHGRGLMDCAKNGLTSVGQFLKQIQNSP